MRRNKVVASAKKRVLTKAVKPVKVEAKKNVKRSSSPKILKSKSLKMAKLVAPPLLSSTCEVDKKPLKPIAALPSKCAIQPPANLPIETHDKENLAILEKTYSAPPVVAPASTTVVTGQSCKSLWNFCLSPRASFWLGVFFGVTIMGVLVVTVWTLFSADLVNASILR